MYADARTMIPHSHTQSHEHSDYLFRDTCSEVNGCQSLYLHGLLRFSLRHTSTLADTTYTHTSP